MVQLNNRKLIVTTIAALLVIAGVVAKNSSEQLKLGADSMVAKAGMAAFIGGWILCAYIFSANKSNKMLFILPSIGVVASVMGMKMMKESQFAMLFPAIFALSWIVLGYGVGNHLSGLMKYSGLVASALVLSSMMAILPFQRKHCNVDGPGEYMFGLAWAILVYLNSMR